MNLLSLCDGVATLELSSTTRERAKALHTLLYFYFLFFFPPRCSAPNQICAALLAAAAAAAAKLFAPPPWACQYTKAKEHSFAFSSLQTVRPVALKCFQLRLTKQVDFSREFAAPRLSTCSTLSCLNLYLLCSTALHCTALHCTALMCKRRRRRRRKLYIYIKFIDASLSLWKLASLYQSIAHTHFPKGDGKNDDNNKNNFSLITRAVVSSFNMFILIHFTTV